MDERRSSTAVIAPPHARPGASLGERVRELRRGRGLTQGALAGTRFSKEYISQIECGKTRPTAQTLDWLAEQLGVDLLYLEAGMSSGEYELGVEALDRAEAAIQAKDYADAVALLQTVPRSPDAPDLHLRALLADSWARMYLGELRAAVALLEEARQLSDSGWFGEAERAEVLFQLACCRYKLSSIDPALALFSEALQLAECAALPSDRLRAHILVWRARCYRRYRDWEAAREDIELALELAEHLSDDETAAHVYFQASLVAERSGSWVRARAHAEHAKKLYEAVDDRVNVGRLLNNLGGLNFLLGKRDVAIGQLKEAFAVALDSGSEPDAAQAVSSLAQAHLRNGDYALAEKHAHHALELLAGRVDFLDEIGNAQLVLGRALLDQDRLDEADGAFAAAEATLTQLSSSSHSAAAWTAQGDLALRRGDETTAGAHYRRAAEALQEIRF
jgi:tetratricopeptide (TPR) repeat protein